MTLKEMRILYDITQEQAAHIMGVSRKTYIMMERDEELEELPKYNAYRTKFSDSCSNNFETKVILGNDLKPFINKVKKYKTRYCFKTVLDYVKNDNAGKVCILYGLRRTGKTTILFQLLKHLNLQQTAYIKIDSSNDLAGLIEDIDALKKRGVVNVLIDEITLLKDFIDSSSLFSDIYAMSGMKIILSGTDSLGFALADRDELYDRNIMVHTSYISYKEFSYLMNSTDIDTYIEYGGTLKAENMSFDDIDARNDEVAFKDEESTRKYIYSAICRNIQKSLENYQMGSRFLSLQTLYRNNELTNAINRIIQNMNHEFVLDVITQRFKSSDLGSSKNLLTKTGNVTLHKINEEQVLERLKKLIDIKEKEELKSEYDEYVLKQIKIYLTGLDLIRSVDIYFDNGKKEERIIFTQPGMRYSIAKALVFSLLEDEYFASLSKKEKKLITDTILNDVKGRMLEDIVLLETKINSPSLDVFKLQYIDGGEYDMVTYDPKKDQVNLYEIKHSKEISFEKQSKYLNDERMLDYIKSKYSGNLTKVILYRGEETIINDVQYLNVEQFLKQ